VPLRVFPGLFFLNLALILLISESDIGNPYGPFRFEVKSEKDYETIKEKNETPNQGTGIHDRGVGHGFRYCRYHGGTCRIQLS
jgi:hypothetical protein